MDEAGGIEQAKNGILDTEKSPVPKVEYVSRHTEGRSAEASVASLAESIEKSGIRRDLDKERQLKAAQKPHSIDTVSIEAADESISRKEPGSLTSKLKEATGKIAWNTRLGFTMLAQFGGLHPWRSEGKWVWVLEPWARVTDDPRQSPYSNESDYYFKLFNSVSSRIINLESMDKASPNVTPDGFGGIQLLDHRRIHEAKNAGKAIVVEVQNLQGAPKSFN